MGAVEHLKTLCCLGLKAESAMVAVTPLLHKIIPHGWTRMALMAPDATMGRGDPSWSRGKAICDGSFRRHSFSGFFNKIRHKPTGERAVGRCERRGGAPIHMTEISRAVSSGSVIRQ
jgi:hypothetical protein